MTRRRPVDAPAPPHSDAAHRAITDELVRLTLRSRPGERPELLVGFAGITAKLAAAHTAALAFSDAVDAMLWRAAAAFGSTVRDPRAFRHLDPGSGA